ncbi:MAG: caspase family protein [Cyanobacteria bacterium P01_H01_bin.58]
MTLGRREFLQKLGAALAVLGVSDTALMGLSTHYQQALASSSRRLALLIGINQYPDSVYEAGASLPKGALLQGATTDVALQQELLLHRFGVPTADVLTLTNEQATRQNILDAIEEHLLKQVKAGDTVILHFSGLGSQVHLADQPSNKSLSTLVTVDSQLPTEANPVIRDLFEETLAETLSSLKGVQMLTILDAGGAAPLRSLWRGNFRVRSRLTIPTGQWNSEISEAYKEPRKVVEKLSASWPGSLLRATHPGNPALEGTWQGFSAGVFTYALTQQIWQSSAPQQRRLVFYRVKDTIHRWTGTQVSAELRGKSSLKEKRNHLVLPFSEVPAGCDGAVQSVDAATQQATLWLGGIAADLLPFGAFGLRLQSATIPRNADDVNSGSLVVKETQGLTAQATWETGKPIPIGTPLLEVERRLPRDINLTVALDSALERIERVDATSALAGLSYITTTSPGEQWADCIFGRPAYSFPADNPASATRQGSISETPESRTPEHQPGFCLFTPGNTVIPGSIIDTDEAVKTAVGRLSGALQALLAIKLLRLTANASSSQLRCRATLANLNLNNSAIAVEATSSAQQSTQAVASPKDSALNVTGDRKNEPRVRIQLANLDEQPLYYLIIHTSQKGRMLLYCCVPESSESANGMPSSVSETAEDSKLLPGSTLQFPHLENDALSLSQLQSSEIFVIACTQPFYETWRSIQAENEGQPNDYRLNITNPLAMAQAILNDIHQAGTGEKPSPSSGQETILTLRSPVWATLVLQLSA